MPGDPNDFWPDLKDVASVVTPVNLLRQQAATLSEKTNGDVRAYVNTDASGESFVHRFNVIVPGLDDYTYELFQIHHGMNLYPVTWYHLLENGRLDSEADLVEWLRKTLSSAHTRQVLLTLLAQVRR
jgi:hypothetical protein